MKFALEIGEKEKSKVELSRNWFTGAMQILVDGNTVVYKSPFSLSTHFSFRLKRHYEFDVGGAEKHKVRLEKERPPLWAAFRAQIYRVFVDGQLSYEQRGF